MPAEVSATYALSTLKEIAGQLQELGAVQVTLTGGEPLLRADLEEIAAAFDESTCLTLNTTGDGLTPQRARALRDAGIFSIGVSIDSTDADEHDRMRGREGAFRTAVESLRLAAQHGLYPYVIAVATHDFLQADRFDAFMRFAGQIGAMEVHLLEPCATGKLAGDKDAVLAPADKQLILKYQKEVAQDDSSADSFLFPVSRITAGIRMRRRNFAPVYRRKRRGLSLQLRPSFVRQYHSGAASSHS